MKVQAIEGIGAVFGDKLAAAGVATTGALLKAGSSPSGRKGLAARSGIEEKKILEWVNHCDLMRVSGVGPEYSDLLEAAGVDTVRELAQRRPDNLHARIIEVNEAKKLVRRPPSAGMVGDWVTAAKELPRGITY
ncbi:MAG: DUF4332 domain-containing protein [Dehalococcoidia bacterium]